MEPLKILGDFNIDVDRGSNCNHAARFIDTLQSMGLTQHVTGPTHKDGHTPDLIITRSFERVVSTKPVIDTYVSDHASIICDIDCCKPVELNENVTLRKLKSIGFDALRHEVTSSVLCTGEFSDLEVLVTCYNSTLTKLLDAHAPVMTKTVVKRKCVPRFSNDIRLAIRSRAAERKWCKSNLAQDYLSFKNLRNRATYIMSTGREEYFSDFISQNSTNQAKLFQSVKTLLWEPCKTPFLPDVSPKILANEIVFKLWPHAYGIHFLESCDARVTLEEFKRHLKAHLLSHNLISF